MSTTDKRLRDMGGGIYTTIQVPFSVGKLSTPALARELERGVGKARAFLNKEVPKCAECDRVEWSQETSTSPVTMDREVLVKGLCKSRTCPDEEKTKITGYSVDQMWIDEFADAKDDQWMKSESAQKWMATLQEKHDADIKKLIYDSFKESLKPPTPRNKDIPLSASAGEW